MDDLISRQAAIDALDVLCEEHRYRIPGKRETYSQYNEAWQDALDRAEGAIFNLPSEDVVEVVRCKDCKYQDKGENESESWNVCKYRPWLYFGIDDDDYCSNGERKDE